jgi:asparagine synthase (glutamine-hydrolysing)
VCGIAGFERGRNDAQTASILRERLARRGPDGGWFESCGPYGFVQTRLAVIDLSERVRYPLRNETGELWLLFNGEIYGYQDHRDELRRRGHEFATECDAEIVLHGYEEWGDEVFGRLDGMFALALFDTRSEELVLARDALGIKPLVYTTTGRFAFGSDALALVAAGLHSGELDASLLSEFLAFHYLLPPHTGLKGVVQLAPGELVRRTAAGELTRRRWRAAPFTTDAASERISTAEAGRALDRSVSRQLVADVPVGVFLSSGIDSALVLESAVRMGATPVAFTLGFPGQGDYDEVPAAARLAADLGVEHVTGELGGGFSDSAARVAGAFDQPFADGSAIAMVELATLARRSVTVALSGTGGDDLFAGYNRHRLHLYANLVGRLPGPALSVLRRLAPARGAERTSAASLLRSYAARLAGLSRSDPLAQYAQLVGSASSPAAFELLAFPDGHEVDLLGGAALPGGSTLRRVQALELQTYLPGDLLPKEDRTSMAVGLEARVPMLGVELLELAERMADGQKVGLTAGKRLLRSLARDRLPSYLTRTRKRGFAVPLAELFSGPWHAEAVDWFADTPTDLIDGQDAARRLRKGDLPATDSWALAMLVAWEGTVREARGRSSRVLSGAKTGQQPD